MKTASTPGVGGGGSGRDDVPHRDRGAHCSRICASIRELSQPHIMSAIADITRAPQPPDAAPIIRVADIPGAVPYRLIRHARTSLHVGQLKLLLSEIQFLTDYACECIRADDNTPRASVSDDNTSRLAVSDDAPPSSGSTAYVIYAGSGPGHTRQMLANMFPRAKFILIDPQEHNIMGSNPRDRLYFRAASATEFPNLEIDFATRDGIIRANKGVARTLAHLSPDEIARVIVREPKYTFYIIEDLFTDDLARALKYLARDHPQRVYFISDIRTNIRAAEAPQRRRGNPADEEESDSPSDIDILANNAWQHTWVDILRPDACMLKFRTPFMNPSDLDSIVEYGGAGIYGATIAAYNARFGVDLLALYRARKYPFIDCAALNLQAFPGAASSEVRLVATPREYTRMREYSARDHENAMFYYNLMRQFRFVENNRAHFDSVPGFDGCCDCALALDILARYVRARDPSATDASASASAISLLDRALTMTRRTIKQRLHGFFFAPFATPQDALASVIANNVASAATDAITRAPRLGPPPTAAKSRPRDKPPPVQQIPLAAQRALRGTAPRGAKK